MKAIFVGHLKKLLGKKEISIQDHPTTISELLNYLNTLKVDNDVTIKRENTLLFVNGVEVSALDGLRTKLNEQDIVTLVPVTHGG